MKFTLRRRLIVRLGEALERRRPWHRRRKWLGLLCLIAIRIRLRLENLYDPAPRREPGSPPVGGAGFPFGRNQPLWGAPRDTSAGLLDPSPREVSRRLLARNGDLKTAGGFNLLGAAWLQFQVHDWISHGKGDPARPILIPLAEDDDWPAEARSAGGEMELTRTREVPRATEGGPPVHANVESHWWDASQVYGTTPERALAVRDPAGGGRLLLADGGLPADPEHGVELAGVNGNWWVGLSLVHTLFAREHNAICAMLADRHHDWDDRRLFEVARRVNAALIAKIHTVEWTLAILPHPTVRAALRANWYGLFGPRGSRLFRRTRSDTLAGIPGSRRDDHGVPFSLTEEFVGVYRMHPLIPDEFRIVGHRDGAERPEPESMLAFTGTSTRDALDRLGRETLMASFGVGRAGALALRNYPDTLRDLPRGPTEVAAGDERRIDLATIDIARDRERGLPRYNDFRRMLRLPPLGFGAISSGDAEIEATLRDLYDDDPDRVDLMVGLYGEEPPAGFGFSETAFRIFVLMASRRLKADPLFTDDWGPELYTEEGLRWIEEATMSSVIARNMPALAPLMADVENAFVPWDDPSNRRSGRVRPFTTAEASA
jgi:hypothetical protein